MAFEQPRGWIDVDFSGVGDAREAGDGGSASESSSGDDDVDDRRDAADEEARLEKKRRRLPLLRCMLLQVQIRENHQNGKDTHLRGLQIFALDRSVNERVVAEPVRAPALDKRQNDGVKGKGREKKKWSGREPLWAGIPGIR